MAKAKKEKAYDDIMHVQSNEAITVARDLAINEGICSGISGGGVLAAALRLAKELPAGQSVLAILADTGERYLSTALFDGVPIEMGNEEKYLDATTIAEEPRGAPLPKPSRAAIQFVEDQISNNTVVIWALQDCEKCQALTDFFQKLHVKYLRIDIDSFKYSENMIGTQYHAVLKNITGDKDLPKVFVSGKYIGGIKETLITWSNGKLKAKLEKASGSSSVKVNGDPTQVFPKWIVKEHTSRSC